MMRKRKAIRRKKMKKRKKKRKKRRKKLSQRQSHQVNNLTLTLRAKTRLNQSTQ